MALFKNYLQRLIEANTAADAEAGQSGASVAVPFGEAWLSLGTYDATDPLVGTAAADPKVWTPFTTWDPGNTSLADGYLTLSVGGTVIVDRSCLVSLSTFGGAVENTDEVAAELNLRIYDLTSETASALVVANATTAAATITASGVPQDQRVILALEEGMELQVQASYVFQDAGPHLAVLTTVEWYGLILMGF